MVHTFLIIRVAVGFMAPPVLFVGGFVGAVLVHVYIPSWCILIGPEPSR